VSGSWAHSIGKAFSISLQPLLPESRRDTVECRIRELLPAVLSPRANLILYGSPIPDRGVPYTSLRAGPFAVKLQFLSIISLLAVLFAGVTVTVTAQSSDQSLPTPVVSNEIEGSIAPLDLGDSRLTRYFYAFEGTPGDLVLTVNSRNLNGDMDIFTAVTFRPLMKISIYANTIPPEVTKSIYLRTKQILILRVEARSPNDDAGNYRIRFSGAYAPFSGGIPVAESSVEKTEVAGNKPGTRRVNSVGATIAEPPSETPSATPEPTPKAETATEKPTEDKEAKTASPRSARTRPPRSTSTARNPRRRPPPARPKPTPPKTETATTNTEEPKKETGEGEGKSAVTTPEKPATEEKPAAQEPTAPQPGARLIIEEKDGTRIDRPMSTIRRVVVEGGGIVIVLKTGRIERIPMSNVSRMAIEP
jgi:hypothetical protein